MYVKGVGPKVAELLAAKEIQTAEDLLYHLPFRYEDRQNPRSLDELVPGETASVIAEVRGAMLLRTRKMPIFELTVGQGTAGAEVHLVQRQLSGGQVSRRALGRVVWQSRAVADYSEFQDDSAAVRAAAR